LGECHQTQKDSNTSSRAFSHPNRFTCNNWRSKSLDLNMKIKTNSQLFSSYRGEYRSRQATTGKERLVYSCKYRITRRLSKCSNPACCPLATRQPDSRRKQPPKSVINSANRIRGLAITTRTKQLIITNSTENTQNRTKKVFLNPIAHR
jgi:hypothetical protein